MNTNKETMKVITEGTAQTETCRMIDEIAEIAADSYEEILEFDLDDISDYLIKDLLAKTYMRGSYKEALEIISLVFRMTEMNTAEEMIRLIVKTCGNEGAYKQFLDGFFRLIAVPDEYVS